MDEANEIEVTNTIIERFDCGCTTVVKNTSMQTRQRKTCRAHQGTLVREENVAEYVVCGEDNSTRGTVARSISGA